MRWVDFHLLNYTVKENKWSFAVKEKATKKVEGYMHWHLVYVQVGGTVLKMFRLFQNLMGITSQHVANLMYQELFRIVNLNGFSQGLMFSVKGSILKPIVTLTSWVFNFKWNFLLPHSPKTPGWRAMTSKDILSALALTNKYTSQFEIRQVFQIEEEFSHYFMCPVIENHMQAYVVEDPVTGDITDVAGFKHEQDGHGLYAAVKILVAAKSPARQLLIDLLVCAKQAKVDVINTIQYGLTSDVFENLFSIQSHKYYYYVLNYHYNEVDESQVCLFC